MTPSIPRLSDQARHVVIPAGAVTTGWPATSTICRQLGATFEPWQDATGRLILAKRADGKYAASSGVVLSIPRQVGKTYLIGWIVLALCLQHPGLLVLWSAHRAPTADMVYQDLRKMIMDNPKLRRHISRASAPAGNGEIDFRNGSALRFGARERGWGRGFQKVGIVVFDEGQILTEAAVDDQIPATNRSAAPLIFTIGTPPTPRDIVRGVADIFTEKRNLALDGASDSILYVEFSADADADPLDPAQWAKANPSFPTYTDAEAMMRMHGNLTAGSFMREALGIWDPRGGTAPVMPGWADLGGLCLAPGAVPTGLGIAANQDVTQLHIGAAYVAAGGGHLVRVLDPWPAHDRAGFAAHLKSLQDLTGVTVHLAKNGPGSDLLSPTLWDAGVLTVEHDLAGMVAACNDLVLAAAAEQLHHLDQGELTAAAEDATWRAVGDKRVFARKVGDIAPLEAVTMAYAAAAAHAPPAVW